MCSSDLGTANPPEVIGSLRLSLSHDEMLMINADIFLPRELTAVEIEFASFVSQRLGEPIQSAPQIGRASCRERV